MVLDFGPEEDGGEGDDAAVQAERTLVCSRSAVQSDVLAVRLVVLLAEGWHQCAGGRKCEHLCEMRASFSGEVKDDKDMSNYENIPDSTELPPAVPASADPFVDW